MLTDGVMARIEREYVGDDVEEARRLVARIGEECSMWKEVSLGDRVEHAALQLGGGEVTRLRKAVDLALRDWRDLLVAAGEA